MHGAHRSRNVLNGVDHPRYKNGEKTKEIINRHRHASIVLLTLRDIGDYLEMFTGTHTRGRKPNNYIKFNMKDSEQLTLAILAASTKRL